MESVNDLKKKALKDNKCETSLVNVGWSTPAYFHMLIEIWNSKIVNKIIFINKKLIYFLV